MAKQNFDKQLTVQEALRWLTAYFEKFKFIFNNGNFRINA
jgi:hypothetical protein